MGRNRKTGLRLLGGLLVLVLCAALLPAGVYAAGDTYAVDEDSVYDVSSDAARPLRAAQAVRDNVTMRLFNYTGDISGQGPLDFFHGKRYGTTVDGYAEGSGARPGMAATLVDGWPYVNSIPGSEEGGSLGYLFNSSAVTGKTAYDVGSGGSTGLFQRDSEGYLYYDSLQNAAGYDDAAGRFRLYDGIVRPYYTGYVEPEGKTVFENRKIAFNGNFLPFNDLTGAEETPTGKTPRTYRLPEEKTDLWFGMTMEFDFFMPAGGQINGKDMVFQFLGDDDVFVYIDDVLVLDIGGTHGANSGSINFADGTVIHPKTGLSGDAGADDYETGTLAAKFSAAGAEGVFSGQTFADYTKHTLKFFYLERGGNVSYCYLRFNTPTLPDKSLTVAKELSGGGEALNGYLTRALDYRFRVLRPDGSLYVPADTAYQVLEGTSVTGSGRVDTEGYFTLKAGQMAQFTDMMTRGGGAYDYIVEETMPSRLTGQYEQVQYTVGSGTGTAATPSASADFTGYRTGTLTAAETQLVTYRNVVDTAGLGELRVTKQVAEGSAAAPGQTFDIGVALGGSPVPAGTPYTVNGEARTVETAGTVPLAHGETAVFGGLLAGTAYAVTETPPEGFRAGFAASITADGETTDAGPSGEVPMGGSAAVTVTNATYDYAVEIPLHKTLLGGAGASGTFRFLLEETDREGTVLRQLSETAVTVTGGQTAGGRLVLGFTSGDTAPHYYRIREAEAAGMWQGGETYRLAVLPNGVDGAVRITVNEALWDGGALSFVNRAQQTLTVSKTVQGELGDRAKAFSFAAAMTLDGQNIPFPEGTGYAVESGRAVFTLRHGESLTFTGLPYGAVVTVEETDCAGYTVTNSSRAGSSGAMELNGDRVLRFTNTKRAVPDMGLSGPTLLPAGLLAAACGGLALTRRRRRGL